MLAGLKNSWVKKQQTLLNLSLLFINQDSNQQEKLSTSQLFSRKKNTYSSGG